MSNCLVAFILQQPAATQADRFFQPFGFTTGAVTTTEYFVQMPFAATLDSLFVSAPGGGYTTGTGTATYTVRVNGANTALACSVAFGASPYIGSNTVNTIAVSAGDTISVRVSQSAAATGTSGDVLVSIGCQSSGPKSVLEWQCSGASPSTAARFMFPYSGVPVAAAASERFILVPRAGTLRNLRARAVTAVAGTGNITYTVRVNGVSTALTCVVSKGASPHEGSDLVNTVVVAAHDRVSLQVVYSATGAPNPASLFVSVEFEG